MSSLMTTQHKPKHKQGATKLGILAILFWSSTVALARSSTENFGAIPSAIFVYGFGSILLYAIDFKIHKSTPLTIFKKFSTKYLVLCGSLFAINNVCFYVAIGFAKDINAVLGITLVNYTWPTLTIFFSLFIFKKKVNSPLFLTSILIAIIGVFLVITQNTSLSISALTTSIAESKLAYLAALIATITWGLFSNLTSLLDENNEISAVSFFMLVTTILLIPLLFILPEETTKTISLTQLMELFVLTSTSALGYHFWDWGMRKGDATLIASVSYLIPFFSSLSVCFYFGASTTSKLWIGCLMIIVGALLSKKSITSSKTQPI